MVKIPDTLRSLFTTTIESHNGTYTLEVPASEIDSEALQPGRTYRIAVLDPPATEPAVDHTSDTEATVTTGSPSPPVDEGEIRTVSVESVGDQGDGIAKVERGYVVIVPDAHPGDEPTVAIEDVQENVAFARIVESNTGTVSESN